MVRRFFERYLNVGIFVMKVGRVYFVVMSLVYGSYLVMIRIIDYLKANFKKVLVISLFVAGISVIVIVVNKLKNRWRK